MAQRKDQMRIIRQDAGFSAKLGFGGPVAGQASSSQATVALLEAERAHRIEGPGSIVPVVMVAADAATAAPEPIGGTAGIEHRPSPQEAAADIVQTLPNPAPARGQVVYVAVSLTPRQAALAADWAAAARCSVPFLVRRVAQALRDEVFSDWAANGMPEIAEPRGTRGRNPTSVTLTLPTPFAERLAARHDPLGVLGLARVMGPAFRARFETAFDLALAQATPRTRKEGDDT